MRKSGFGTGITYLVVALLSGGCSDSPARQEETSQAVQGLGAGVTRWSAQSGDWSSAATWQGGALPEVNDVVGIADGHQVLLDIPAPPALGGLLVQGTLELDEALSIELQIDASMDGEGGEGGHSTVELAGEYNNIVVEDGTLRLRPDSASVRHTITFKNVDESQYRGGGMAPVSTDPGLWVLGHGQLDAQGASKTAWTRLQNAAERNDASISVEDATGWRAGDTVVVVPTLKPALDSSSWASYDTFEIASAPEDNVVSLNGSLVHPHPRVNERWQAEVLNLSRNVVIQGTPGHRAHIMFMHSHVAQTLRDIEIRHMGPRKSFPGVSGQQSILGRYGLHFHMGADGTRGTLVKGLALHQIGSHAFVPHASHGITMEDCISHDTWDEAFWWDRADADASHDTKWTRNVASQVQVNPPNSVKQLAGFVLGAGQGNSVTGSVAVGVTSERFAAGFIWPENEIKSAWEFRDNVAHNTAGRGFFTWQNGPNLHVVEDSVIYHNPKGSVEHGAYALRYHYRNIEAFGNGGGFYIHAVSAADAVSPQTFENIEIDGDGLGHGFIFLKHNTQLGLTAPTLIRNSRVSNLSEGGVALGFIYDDISQSPGDPGRDVGQLNPSTHREWLKVIDSEFSCEENESCYFLSGSENGGIKYGIVADSEIYEETLAGGRRLLHSKFFDPIFHEEFNATSTSMWPWQWVGELWGGPTAWSVANGAGVMGARTPQGTGTVAYVKTRMAVDVGQTVTFTIADSESWGGLIARRPDDDRETYYQAHVGGAASGHALAIGRVIDGTFVAIEQDTFSLVPGEAYKLRFEAETSGAHTLLRAKIWLASEVAPDSWTVEGFDNAPLLQGKAGRFGVVGSTQSGNVTFDDYLSNITDPLVLVPAWNAKVQTVVPEGTPKVSAGANQSAQLPAASVPLSGWVRHNDLLNPAGTTYNWSKLEGPGTVTFASATSRVTSASFDSAGVYRLRLSATKGGATGGDDVVVTVTAPQANGVVTESWNGSGAWPAQWATVSSFTVAAPTIDMTGTEGRIKYNGVPNMPSNGGGTVAYVQGRDAENIELFTTAQAILNNGVAGVIARRTDSDPNTYLAAVVGTLGSSSSSVRIWAVVDGNALTIAETSLKFGSQFAGIVKTDLRFQVHTQADGRLSLRARAWAAGTTENTDSWTLEVTDWENAIFQGRSGRFGVTASAGQSGRGGLFDAFSATTNDEPAIVTIEETWTGANNTVWPSRWSPAVATSVADIYANEGRIPWFGQFHINTHNARDVNILTQARLELNNGRAGVFALRADDDDDSYVAARFGGTASAFDAVRLYYVVDGVKTDIKTLTSPFEDDVNYQVRFVIESGAAGSINLRLRIWDPLVSPGEPSTWTLEEASWQHPRFTANAAEPNNTTGRFGILNEPGQSGRKSYFDNFKAVFVPR